MNAIDDSMLMAYLDGELDETDAREVEALAASDSELEEKIKDFRQSDALLRAAFNHVMFETGGPVAFPDSANRQKREENRTPGIWAPLPVALAASLAVLLIGGFGGFAMLDSLVDREFERRVLLREKDAQVMLRARDNVLEKELSGTEVSWVNPDSGNFGKTLPVQTWRTETGRYCREFQESITVDGATTVEHGVACRLDDGSWKVRLRYFPD